MSRWEVPLSALSLVRDECLGKRSEEDGDGDLDAFTRQKKKIGNKIKKIREVLQKRDNFIKSKMEVEAIKFSNVARIQIADVFEDAEKLKQIHEKDEKKFRKKAQEDDGVKQLLINRNDIIRLTFAHIQECEMLEAQREVTEEKTAKKRTKLFELKERPKPQKQEGEGEGSYGIVKLPDIDKIPDISVQEGFDQQDKNDQRIDGLLDDVLKGVVDLKEYANQMKDKIEISNVMIDDIGTDVDQANDQLKDINLQLKKTLKKLRSPKKLFFDICLCLLFLGLIGLIIKVILDRR